MLRALARRLNARPAPISRGTGAETREGRHRSVPMTPLIRRWEGSRWCGSIWRRIRTGVRACAVEKTRPRALTALLAALPLRLGGLSFNDLALVERADALDVVAGDREASRKRRARQATV
jgi:hypothetical protein